MISPCEELIRREPAVSEQLSPDCLDYFIRKAHRLRSDALFARLRHVLRRIWRGRG